MSVKSGALLLVCVVFAAHALGAVEPAFAAKPAAAREGDRVRITFTASAPTDVEVAVLDGAGKVVRHLAAGMLGPNAPEPLKKDSLAQELTWDGKDDASKPVSGARNPLSVRVSLGLRPALEKMLGDNPGALGSVRGLAVGPAGELFVFVVYGAIHPDDGTVFCQVFSREGKYLRTILPFPASLPEEKLAGLKRVGAPEGPKIPFIYNAETRSLVPGAGDLIEQQPVVTADGRLLFVGHQETIGTASRYNRPGTKQVTVIQADGSMPPGGPLKTVLATGTQCGGVLAAAPDGRTFYATQVWNGGGKSQKGQHAVYRFTLDDKAATPFLGTPDAAGSGEKGFGDPGGLAVDKDGNLYVADRGNNRVAVFKPDGAFLGEIKVDKPLRVAVHAKSGAVYVLGGDNRNELSKFASWKDATPAAAAKTPYFKHANYSALLAVDASGETPVVWVGTPSSWAGFLVLRIEDKGATFGEQVKLEKTPGCSAPSAGPLIGMALDRAHGRLLVGAQVCDVATDKWSAGTKAAGGGKDGGGSFGLDGNFYSQSYPNLLTRFSPDLAKLPFTAGEKGAATGLSGSLRLRGRGVTADAAGNVYALWQKGGSDPNATTGDANNLCVHTPDGKITNDKLIDSDIRGLNSPRFDARGNIYLAIGVRPKGKKVPESFPPAAFGKVWEYGVNTCEMEWYQLLYGCIVKFGPEGGEIKAGNGGAPVDLGYLEGKGAGMSSAIKGARWIYFGASPVPNWRLQFPDTCLCESPRFDVDPYGRSFFPDAARFRMGVLDANGNEVTWFGSYGNADSAGPKSAVPVPAIPFYWPYMVEVNDGVVYVGDRMNRRVVVVRLGHAAEETCEVK
jgi:DNA-binding beta-propeller fold protein YncE